MFDSTRPFNELPALLPTAAVGTVAVLKKANAVSRTLAELKCMAERMPNQAMLIDSLVLQQARGQDFTPDELRAWRPVVVVVAKRGRKRAAA